MLLRANDMQIPYDLEFVENRPTVAVRVVALREPYSASRSEGPRKPDVFDTFLQWAFRMIRRLEAGHQAHPRR